MEWCVKASQYADLVVGYAKDFENIDLAVEYYKKAAELGNPWGMVQYMETFWRDDKCIWEYNKWKKKARKTNDPYVKWYTEVITVEEERDFRFKAVNEGNTSAMCYMWRHSRQTKEDFEFLSKSALSGHIIAQYDMGMFLHKDDIAKAYYWLKKSAEAGYIDAKEELKKEEYMLFYFRKNTRSAIFTLICIKKYLHIFPHEIPMHIILIIAHFLWDTRNEQIWDFDLKKTIKKQKLK
jgi:TPR repeat protein